MITILTQIFYAIVWMFILWIFFINVMTWKANKERIPKFMHPILYILTFVGIVVDVVFNIVYGTIIFAKLPHYKRLTFSARLSYVLIKESQLSWRFKIAYLICTKLIEPWDYNHCGLAKLKGE